MYNEAGWLWHISRSLQPQETAEDRAGPFGMAIGRCVAAYHAVDFGPGGEGAEVAVVYVYVGGHFAAALVGGCGRGEFLRIV